MLMCSIDNNGTHCILGCIIVTCQRFPDIFLINLAVIIFILFLHRKYIYILRKAFFLGHEISPVCVGCKVIKFTILLQSKYWKLYVCIFADLKCNLQHFKSNHFNSVQCFVDLDILRFNYL